MEREFLLSAAAALLATCAFAGSPVQDLSSSSIAVDYSGVWRGAEITALKVPAHESVHHVNVRYAPLPFLMLSAGLGGANISVDTCQQRQFKGGFNFSPSLGLALFTPPLIKNRLRVTAGAKAHYLYTRDQSESFVYSGPVVVPHAGVIVSLNGFVDLEAGGRGLLMLGRMQEGGGAAQEFSNAEQKRAYLSVTLHTPAEGAYLSFDFDASPGIDMDWAGGPAESSIGVSVGVILRQPNDKMSRKMSENEDYPGFREMEKKIEEMEKSMR
ncbi:MAG: hypothetical protein JXA71_04470 [Chitinispirillaceae bacterium]|nr:hypothetical protein [Chitinispirillaceae bacterium]